MLQSNSCFFGWAVPFLTHPTAPWGKTLASPFPCHLATNYALTVFSLNHNVIKKLILTHQAELGIPANKTL